VGFCDFPVLAETTASGGGRFTRQHAQLFAKMKTLAECEEEKLAAHARNNKGLSQRLQVHLCIPIAIAQLQ
jgi:hypothetical protein